MVRRRADARLRRLDGWPSGLRRTPGKRVGCNSPRGFESRPIRLERNVERNVKRAATYRGYVAALFTLRPAPQGLRGLAVRPVLWLPLEAGAIEEPVLEEGESLRVRRGVPLRSLEVLLSPDCLPRT